MKENHDDDINQKGEKESVQRERERDCNDIIKTKRSSKREREKRECRESAKVKTMQMNKTRSFASTFASLATIIIIIALLYVTAEAEPGGGSGGGSDEEQVKQLLALDSNTIVDQDNSGSCDHTTTTTTGHEHHHGHEPHLGHEPHSHHHHHHHDHAHSPADTNLLQQQEQRQLLSPHHHQHGGGGHGHLSCGTQSLPYDQQIRILEEMRVYGERKKRQRERALRSQSRHRHGRRELLVGGPYTVPVRFVDIKASSAVPDIPPQDIQFSFDLLNTHFSETDFTFVFLETVHVVDNVLSKCPMDAMPTHGNIGAAYRQGNTTVMNVFLCDMDANGQNAPAGITYFPYYLPIDLRFDGIFIDPVTLGDTGQTQNILSHEAGHWLGLQHTFENGCEYPGDWIDDTPYHTLLFNEDKETCNDKISTCPSEAAPAPIENIMGYVVDCGNRFSPQQIEFMCNVYENYRLRGSDEDAFCFLDVTIQWNANPKDVKISIRNNGIFYLTYDGNGTDPVYAPNQLVTEAEDLYYGPGNLIIEDFSDNGFAGGTVSIILYDKNIRNPKTIAQVTGGSFQDFVDQPFTIPENCAVVAATPTSAPVSVPTARPVAIPTAAPASPPSRRPTITPVARPTSTPISLPTFAPNLAPTSTSSPQNPPSPTTGLPISTPKSPTSMPISLPTFAPNLAPTSTNSPQDPSSPTIGLPTAVPPSLSTTFSPNTRSPQSDSNGTTSSPASTSATNSPTKKADLVDNLTDAPVPTPRRPPVPTPRTRPAPTPRTRPAPTPRRQPAPAPRPRPPAPRFPRVPRRPPPIPRWWRWRWRRRNGFNMRMDSSSSSRSSSRSKSMMMRRRMLMRYTESSWQTWYRPTMQWKKTLMSVGSRRTKRKRGAMTK